ASATAAAGTCGSAAGRGRGPFRRGEPGCCWGGGRAGRVAGRDNARGLGPAAGPVRPVVAAARVRLAAEGRGRGVFLCLRRGGGGRGGGGGGASGGRGAPPRGGGAGRPPPPPPTPQATGKTTTRRSRRHRSPRQVYVRTPATTQKRPGMAPGPSFLLLI